ncbi:hypothetical protein KKB98_00575 [Patescibacteria group bacterium]|nr:hypothetical protein [Patescibacteria group bacterium]MCG2699627.1 hypothetical protein [Candidatus Parcubacteria bacterium]MCG2809643.1 hypothetical protein [Candidatus Portnoybacteria bacterium]
MSKIKQDFLVAIKKSFSAYNKKGGARSTKKLVPIHKFLSKTILKELDRSFSIKSLGIGDGKELKFYGKYYPKNLDIAVLKDNAAIATTSFKFITSNYKQNANNYFENLLGETANIRRRGIGFAHFLVLRGHTPYFSKNKGNLRGKERKNPEILNERNLRKYIKLFQDLDFPHKPDLLGICVLDFDEKRNPFFVNFDDFDFSDKTKDILQDDFSLENFIEKFILLVKLKS